MSVRIERLQELIRQKAATVINRDLNDPRIGLVTVSRVKLSSDLSHCKIYWSTLAEGGKRSATSRGLEDARGYIQREIASILRTRVTPVLSFVFDEAIEGIDRLDRLLREALTQDREAARTRGELVDGGEEASGNTTDPAESSPT